MNIENLKKARKRSGLTQGETANRLGISDGTYKNYEQGKREPNNELFCKIADLFHVTTDYLLGRGIDEPNTLEKLASEFNMTALEKIILDEYLSLPEGLRGNAMDFLYKAVRRVQTETVAQHSEPETIPSELALKTVGEDIVEELSGLFSKTHT